MSAASSRETKARARLVWRVTLVLVLVVSLYASIKYSPYIWHPRATKTWVESYGAYGPIVFMLVHVLQVVIFYIPGEVIQIAGGYLFGGWMGSIYSTIGITIGSIAAFVIGRLLGRPFFEEIVSKRWLAKFDTVTKSQQSLLFLFILFLIPAAPKDMLCYIAGLTQISFLSFVLITTPTRLPNIILSSFFGKTLADQNYWCSFILFGGALVLLLVGYLIKKKFALPKQESDFRE